jgi:hypothetical protein
MKTTIMNIMYTEATKATGALMRPRLNGPGVYNNPPVILPLNIIEVVSHEFLSAHPSSNDWCCDSDILAYNGHGEDGTDR